MCSGRNTHNDKYNSLVWEKTVPVPGRQFCSVFLGSWASHAGHKMWVFAPFSSLPSSVLLYAKTKAYITFCLLLLKILALNSSSGTCFPLSTKMRIKQKHLEFFLAPLTGGQPDRVFFFSFPKKNLSSTFFGARHIFSRQLPKAFSAAVLFPSVVLLCLHIHGNTWHGWDSLGFKELR